MGSAPFYVECVRLTAAIRLAACGGRCEDFRCPIFIKRGAYSPTVVRYGMTGGPNDGLAVEDDARNATGDLRKLFIRQLSELLVQGFDLSSEGF